MTQQRAVEARKCGKCQVCCFAIAVNSEPVSKAAWHSCANQCSKGCAVYDDRPEACAVYRCMWKLGWGLNKHRPDRLGILVEAPGPGCGIFIKETQPRALRSKEGVKVFKLLKQQEPVFVTPFLSVRASLFTGTKEQLNKIIANIAALGGGLGDAARRFLLRKAQLDAEGLVGGREVRASEAIKEAAK